MQLRDVIGMLDDRGLPPPPGTSPDEVYTQIRGWMSTLRETLLAPPEDAEKRFSDLPVLPPAEERLGQIGQWTREAEAIEDDAERTDLLALLADTRDAVEAERVPITKADEVLTEARRTVLADLRRVLI